MPAAAPDLVPPSSHSLELRATGARIDVLLDASSAGGAVARERAEELVRLVTDLYGAGLEQLMELLHENGRLDDDLLAVLAKDELVSSLLILHGLHPYSVETRIEDALEGVRPYLGSHGGDVELLQVTDDGTVRLRLLGSCDGCPSSAVTLKLAVEGAIEAAAPEITVIEVEAASSSTSAGAAATRSAGAVIPVDALRSRLQEISVATAPGPGWQSLPEIGELAPGATTTLAVGASALLVCRIGSDLFAFVDRCARCASSLAGAGLARRMGGAVGDALLRCPACQVHYDVRRAGACVESPQLHLDPLPLLSDGTTVSVALPAPVSA